MRPEPSGPVTQFFQEGKASSHRRWVHQLVGPARAHVSPPKNTPCTLLPEFAKRNGLDVGDLQAAYHAGFEQWQYGGRPGRNLSNLPESMRNPVPLRRSINVLFSSGRVGGHGELRLTPPLLTPHLADDFPGDVCGPEDRQPDR